LDGVQGARAPLRRRSARARARAGGGRDPAADRAAAAARRRRARVGDLGGAGARPLGAARRAGRDGPLSMMATMVTMRACTLLLLASASTASAQVIGEKPAPA